MTAFGLLFVQLLRIERRHRAAGWFVDVGAIVVTPPILWLVELQNQVDPPWWFTAAVGLLIGLHVVRIEIVRGATPRAFMRRYWFGVIPGRRRPLPFESIKADNMFEDGWTNQVVFEAPGERAEFLQWCLCSARIATWLNTQRARLASRGARRGDAQRRASLIMKRQLCASHGVGGGLGRACFVSAERPFREHWPVCSEASAAPERGN